MKHLKSFITFSLLLLFIIPLSAQKERIDLEILHKIKQEGLHNSGIKELSFYMTDYLGPRIPNSTTGERAQKLAADKLKEFGLSNVHLEAWGDFGRGWENEKNYIAMTSPYYVPLIATPRAWTAGTVGPVTGEVVLVNIQDEADFDTYKGKLKGKIVITPSTSKYKVSFDPLARRYTDKELKELETVTVSRGGRRFTEADRARYKKMKQLRRKLSSFYKEEGVLASLFTSTYFGTVRGNGASQAMDAPPTLPEILLTGEHHDRIVRLLQHDVPVKVEMDIKNKFLDDDPTDYNVIGEIPGTDKKLKDEVVMCGAHLDSWHGGTGGADNASGCIVMMEAMRILKAIGASPKRTIKIALWGAEEKGLLGSRAYVKKHFGEPGNVKPEYAGLDAYYNVDNGTGKIRGIYLQGNDMLKPIFKEWFVPLEDMGVTTVTLRNTGGTDHLSFNSAGLNGFQFIQDPVEYGRGYHTNMDTYERLLMNDLMQNAVIVAVMLYNTANRVEPLPRKPIPKPTQGGKF